jgi:glycosyltransferase involved in cell wall biosynthesis
MKYRIAVVTPYYKEPVEMLRHCHESVLEQAVGADHFFIADGFPSIDFSGNNLKHIALPHAHNDNGNTPRGVGSLLADAGGYDFVAFLDADNWFHPNHLASLLAVWEAYHHPVCCSLRTFHRADGSKLPITEKIENSFTHVDTSCVLLHRSAFACLSTWHRMPRRVSAICDRVFVAALKHARFQFGHSQLRTVAFRTQYRFHYEMAKEPPPENAKAEEVFTQCIDYLNSREGVKEILERLDFWPMPYIHF